MLRDKGVCEYIEAARILRSRGVKADLCLLGFLDSQNPTAISKIQMDEWVAEGVIRYLGVSDKVHEEIALADCVVLPSYREGTPRTLLEAAAMARPVITTDVVGCREVVENGVNGYLCRVRDAVDLANKIQQLISLPSEDRKRMGLCGRIKMEQEFDENIVIAKYLAAIEAKLSHLKSI
jgi:glycosyltransferase involved in cell wall biosynthesis